MKDYSGSMGANYHFLLLKEYAQSINKNRQQLLQVISQTISEQIVLKMDKLEQEDQKQILYQTYKMLMEQPWAQQQVQKIHKDLLEKAKHLYEFDTQRNYFLVQNFRQACSEPTVGKQLPECYNLSPLYKMGINKELRRIIWSKCLVSEPHKLQYFRVDHQITPYNLTEQISIGLVRLSLENNMRLKQNQKDCALRVLQYLIKKWDRTPTRGQHYLSLVLVDVYAHFTPSKIGQMGAVFVGLTELTEIYFQPDVNERLQLIKLAFRLVDEDTFACIQNFYFPNNPNSLSQINQCFQQFRLSLTCQFLPLEGAEFVIDQLLIKKRNKLDMYILFAIMVMIMSDDIYKHKQSKMNITYIIDPINTKKVIKLDDVVDAFRVIYQRVHHFHLDHQEPDHNTLLGHLKQFDLEPPVLDVPGGEQKMPSLKAIQNINSKMEGFVVEDKSILRLGAKKK